MSNGKLYAGIVEDRNEHECVLSLIKDSITSNLG